MYKYAIEPEEPVLNESDLLKELTLWAEKEKKKLEILQLGEFPIVTVDGLKLRCRLEPPKRLLVSTANWSFGYKIIYLYELDKG